MEQSHRPTAVIAGLVPATPIISYGDASKLERHCAWLSGWPGQVRPWPV